MCCVQWICLVSLFISGWKFQTIRIKILIRLILKLQLFVDWKLLCCTDLRIYFLSSDCINILHITFFHKQVTNIWVIHAHACSFLLQISIIHMYASGPSSSLGNTHILSISTGKPYARPRFYDFFLLRAELLFTKV